MFYEKIKQQKLLHYINFYLPESMSALSGTVTAVMVLLELLDEEEEPEATGEE